MKQTKDINLSKLEKEIFNNFNPEYFRYYFTQIKEATAGVEGREERHRFQTEVVNRAVDHYSKKLDISPKTARAAIHDIINVTDEPMNIEKNIEKLLFAIRIMSPKLAGLESRENANLEAMKELKSMFSRVKFLERKLEIQEQVFVEAVELMKSNQPTLWNVIKCSLNSLLSFLRLKKRS